MSTGMTYRLTNFLHGLPFEAKGSGFYVADGEDASEDFLSRLELDSHVRSGDYFSTLATRLDDIASRLDRGDELQHEEIDKIVNGLLYVGQHYHLSRKV